jgi:hypothetical protein
MATVDGPLLPSDPLFVRVSIPISKGHAVRFYFSNTVFWWSGLELDWLDPPSAWEGFEVWLPFEYGGIDPSVHVGGQDSLAGATGIGAIWVTTRSEFGEPHHDIGLGLFSAGRYALRAWFAKHTSAGVVMPRSYAQGNQAECLGQLEFTVDPVPLGQAKVRRELADYVWFGDTRGDFDRPDSRAWIESQLERIEPSLLKRYVQYVLAKWDYWANLGTRYEHVCWSAYRYYLSELPVIAQQALAQDADVLPPAWFREEPYRLPAQVGACWTARRTLSGPRVGAEDPINLPKSSAEPLPE